jgi:hypothetical protein
MQNRLPATRCARLRLVESAAWLTALQLRGQGAQAELVSDALELLSAVLADMITDRQDLHRKVAGLSARALAQFCCEPVLQCQLEAIADTSDSETVPDRA